MTVPGFYEVDVDGQDLILPVIEIKEGVHIAILNLLGGRVGRTRNLANSLYVQMLIEPDFSERWPEILVTPEAKSIPLCHELAGILDLPYVVLRKSYKPYMGESPLTVKTHSITTGQEQTLILDDKDRHLLSGTKVGIVDDVMSTGSTMNAIINLVEEAAGLVSVILVCAVEGEPELQNQFYRVIKLFDLPVWFD